MRKILCLFTIYLFFTTCVSEVEFKEESNLDNKFVIGALINSDNPIEIYLYKTSNILKDSFEVIEKKNITIYENNVIKGSWIKGTNGKYITDFNPISGKEYKIELTDDIGNIISAKDTIPEKVEITEAINFYPVYTDNYNTTFGKITLAFTDEPNKKNFYEIVILSENNEIVQTLKIKSPIITYDVDHNPNPLGTLLFTDELFNGKQITLDIFSDCDEPSVVLKNVSKSYYEYRKSINIHFYNQNAERYDIYSLFKGDPVELYSNVTNGLGIFAGYTQDIKECTIINQ